MTRETESISANFELILNSIRGAEACRTQSKLYRSSDSPSGNPPSEPSTTVDMQQRLSSAEMPTAPIPSDGLCEECEHPIRLHGKYGCEYERGDNLAGTAALPPCGCQEWEVEEIENLGAATAVVVGQQARANAGSEFKAAASNPFQQHEQAHETFLMSQSGCFE